MTFRHKLSRRLALLRDAILTAPLLLGACEFPTRNVTGAPLQRVVVFPDLLTLLPDQIADFYVAGLTTNGDTVAVDVQWSVTAGTINGLTDGNGRRLGRYRAPSSPGVARVMARETSGLADTAQVTIATVTDPVASVQVVPGVATVAQGATVALIAVPRDTAGNALLGRVVTWSSSAAAIASVDGNGVVTGVTIGTTTITATSEGQSGNAAVTVTNVPVASVAVTPSSATVPVGGTVQLTGVARDSGGSTLSGRPIAWSSSNVQIATVMAGLVTGVAAGTAYIVASSDGKSDTATVTVEWVPVATVTVSPAAVSVWVGQAVQLTATPRDSNGNPLSGRAVTWASSAVGVATVTASGLVAGVTGGSTTITATSEGQSGSSAITVTAALPPTGGSCLTQSGPTLTLSGVKTATYSNTGLVDNIRVDARTAQWLRQGTGVTVTLGGGGAICFSGGEIINQFPPSQDWGTMHNTYALKVLAAPYFTLENVREFNHGDGITIHENSSMNWTLRGVYFKYMRDDCIQNDWLNSGTIEDSFFDGCYQGLSSRPIASVGGVQDGSNNVIVIRNTLYRLQNMDDGWSVPGHGGFFKWDAKSPKVALYDNVWRVDSPSTLGSPYLGPPTGKLQDCANNVMIWLGDGPFPETLPSCYRILTGAEGLQYWNDAVARWKASHPHSMIDVGPPIVSMYSPAGVATLTGTVSLRATAVDDQDVAGVQFKLDGQNIGSEVTAESPITKFTLSWDSRGRPNGTYALTATARDTHGNTKTSASISVTISN